MQPTRIFICCSHPPNTFDRLVSPHASPPRSDLSTHFCRTLRGGHTHGAGRCVSLHSPRGALPLSSATSASRGASTQRTARARLPPSGRS
eukprot:3457557-Pleurochrysis_carterae.AAC.1